MSTDLQVPYQKTALSANGGSNGRLTFVSTAGFRKGATVVLKDDDSSGVILVIADIVSATVLTVRDPSKIGTLLFDCSAFTTAQNAALIQLEQTDFYARTWTWF